ncbi:hypothetical protein AAC387_Pa07g0110 [Persea americana]
MAYNLPWALSCQLTILRAKNLELAPTGNLFIRYYLLDGNNERIKLNSGEVASTSDPIWNENVSLECHGPNDPAAGLRLQSVVFELRWRSTSPLLGRIVRSKLLGRAEISWNDVLESNGMLMEKWVTLARMSSIVVGLKAPALQVRMEVGVLEKVKKRAPGSISWKECSCRHCAYGRDEEIFAIAAALPVL